MPIRPIDMQVLMPKSQNISKMSQDMANKSENLIQQAQNKNKKIEQEKLTKVNNLEKKENPLIQANNRDKTSYSKKGKKTIKDNREFSNNSSKIDIKI